MANILALSLRPTRLSELVGQDSVIKSIRSQMAKRPPRAWMFVGGSGTGKTTIARIMAVAYQCDHQPEGLWGEPCADCWKSRNSFCIHEINAAEVSGVEELGQVAALSRRRPLGGRYRVIILDEAQRITSQAQNLLLKPFEEPPSTTVWIVCTTDPGKLLAPLKRRLTTYQLKSLGFEGREKFLTRIATKVGIARPLAPLFEQVHLAQTGAPGILLQSLEKYAAGATAAEAVGGVEGRTNTLAICKAVTSGRWLDLKKLLADMETDEARWVRSSVSGWLRGILVRESDPKAQDRAATSLLELTAFVPFDETMLQLWLYPVLYKICRRYRV